MPHEPGFGADILAGGDPAAFGLSDTVRETNIPVAADAARRQAVTPQTVTPSEPISLFSENPVKAIGLLLSNFAAGFKNPGGKLPTDGLRAARLSAQKLEMQKVNFGMKLVKTLTDLQGSVTPDQFEGILTGMEAKFGPLLGKGNIARFREINEDHMLVVERFNTVSAAYPEQLFDMCATKGAGTAEMVECVNNKIKEGALDDIRENNALNSEEDVRARWLEVRRGINDVAARWRKEGKIADDNQLPKDGKGLIKMTMRDVRQINDKFRFFDAKQMDAFLWLAENKEGFAASLGLANDALVGTLASAEDDDEKTRGEAAKLHADLGDTNTRIAEKKREGRDTTADEATAKSIQGQIDALNAKTKRETEGDSGTITNTLRLGNELAAVKKQIRGLDRGAVDFRDRMRDLLNKEEGLERDLKGPPPTQTETPGARAHSNLAVARSELNDALVKKDGPAADAARAKIKTITKEIADIDKGKTGAEVPAKEQTRRLQTTRLNKVRNEIGKVQERINVDGWASLSRQEQSDFRGLVSEQTSLQRSLAITDKPGTTDSVQDIQAQVRRVRGELKTTFDPKLRAQKKTEIEALHNRIDKKNAPLVGRTPSDLLLAATKRREGADIAKLNSRLDPRILGMFSKETRAKITTVKSALDMGIIPNVSEVLINANNKAFAGVKQITRATGMLINIMRANPDSVGAVGGLKRFTFNWTEQAKKFKDFLGSALADRGIANTVPEKERAVADYDEAKDRVWQIKGPHAGKSFKQVLEEDGIANARLQAAYYSLAYSAAAAKHAQEGRGLSDRDLELTTLTIGAKEQTVQARTVILADMIREVGERYNDSFRANFLMRGVTDIAIVGPQEDLDIQIVSKAKITGDELFAMSPVAKKALQAFRAKNITKEEMIKRIQDGNRR
jgi:hypothetical protein